MSKPAGDPPLCKCHGEPMRWSKDSSRKNGGRWRCSPLARRYDRRWREANPEKLEAIKARSNARRIRVGDMYLGMCGFTESEIKEITIGSSD